MSRTSTHTISIASPPEKVFAFVADDEAPAADETDWPQILASTASSTR